MLSAIVTSKTLSGQDILPNLAVALACYCEGDSSCLHEWYEPLCESGEISSIAVYLNNRAYIIKGTDYSDLVNLPHIAVKYKGEWIGDTSVSDDFKFIYDESGSEPKLLALQSDLHTKVFG